MNPEAEKTLPERRILLALEDGRELSALEAALKLASLLDASLDTLFVEDADLFQVAGLPFATEIGFGSAVGRRMEAARLERELQNRAQEIQRLLERRTRGGTLRWTFTVTRGTLPEAVLTITPAADLIIVARRGLAPRESRRQPAAPLAVYYDGSEASMRALEAAISLAEGHPLLLLVAPIPGELAETVLPELERKGVRATIVPLEEASAESLAVTVRLYRAGMLVMGDAPFGDAALGQLLERSGVPILLAR